MNCEAVQGEALTEKYVLDQLSGTEREAYELHYFGCQHCFEELRNYQALESALRAANPSIPLGRAAPERQVATWRHWAVAAALLVSTAVAWRGVTHKPVPNPSAQSVNQPAPAAQPKPALGNLRELAKFVPPAYHEVVLRGAESASAERFRAAMLAYTRADFPAAIPGLQAAVRLDPHSAPPEFYLGICYLMTNATDDGMTALRKVGRESLYFESATFYLAKALLRNEDVEGAKRELQSTVALHGDKENEARLLLHDLENFSPGH